MEALSTHDSRNHKLAESQVVRRILGGEKELYEILVKRNNQKLYRVIRSYLKDEAEIEDVMQDSYVKAYTKLYQFELESSFSTWLIRIGINEALARLREKGKWYHIDVQKDDTQLDAILEISDKRQINPQEKMIRHETKQLLENAIDQLDQKYKTVYIMKEVEGMGLKEIALALDLTLANVKVRLHRSRVLLKEKLFKVANENNVFEFGFSRCDRITENVMKLIK